MAGGGAVAGQRFNCLLSPVSGFSAGVLLAVVAFSANWPLWPLLCCVVLLLAWSLYPRYYRAGGAVTEITPAPPAQPLPLLYVTLTLGLCWGNHGLRQALDDRLPAELAGSRLSLAGSVAGLPEVQPAYTRFLFRPQRGQPCPHNTDTTCSALSPATDVPTTLLVYWYREAPPLVPGQVWRLELQLKPPWGRVNFHGPDRERWLFAAGIGGQATVRSGQLMASPATALTHWNRLRHAVRGRLEQFMPEQGRRGLVLALAIADRSQLKQRDALTLSRTGTAHLLAISGLHVGLAAAFGFWLARLVLLLIPPRCLRGQAYPAALLASGMVALVYAGLAGFGTSTVRALIMLAVALGCLLWRRNMQPVSIFGLALAAVLAWDPAAALTAGFWLSFGAVAVLLALFVARRHRPQGRLKQLLLAQAGMVLALMPMTAGWFGLVSPAGGLANLVAIPWVSLVVVPLVLLGLLVLPFSAAASQLVFGWSGVLGEALLQLLRHMASWPWAAFALPQPPAWSVALASLGGLLLMLPRGLPHRGLGVLLFLPLLTWPQPPAAGELQLDVLDAGQGSAVLLSSAHHLLVYDSGPGNGLGHGPGADASQRLDAGSDRGAAAGQRPGEAPPPRPYHLLDSVLLPAIRHSGHRAPSRLLISHADLDHAGGLSALRQQFPRLPVWASLPAQRPGVRACHDELEWGWDGVSFRLLHPSRYLPYQGNDSSCVLSARLGHSSILLSGDISSAIEQRLLGAAIAPHQVLLVPHHGSETSSAPEFLQGIAPQLAIATAGLGNRFGFPRPNIRQRYAAAGIPFLATGDCGGIRVKLNADGGLWVRTARLQRAAPWRWPAAPGCP